jgi:hypothetical protein
LKKTKNDPKKTRQRRSLEEDAVRRKYRFTPAESLHIQLGGHTPAPSPTPVVVPPPKPDRPLNRDEIRELQTLLKKQGFNAGTPDGLIGPKTRAAAKAFARAHQIKDAQSELSLRVLDAARSH